MKSRNIILSIDADSDEYMQACSACTHNQYIEEKESKPMFEARQLYGTEAEDYFFYFIGIDGQTSDAITV